MTDHFHNIRGLLCKYSAGLLLFTFLVSFHFTAPVASAEEVTLFAIVTKVPKEKTRVTAQVSAGGDISEVTLIPSDSVLENPIWKKLEICHSLRAEGSKTSDGYRLTSVKILDAGMLPMPLQGVAGDCLLKKALEFAPLVD
ncbi:MAG: hypothetical protein C4293_18830 [Nitrospiraceae bacterium]